MKMVGILKIQVRRLWVFSRFFLVLDGFFFNVGHGVHWGWISVDTISKAFGSFFLTQKELAGGGGLEKEKCKFFLLQFMTKKDLQRTLTIKITWIA